MKNLRIEKLKSFSLAALLMAGAALAACSSDDNITEEQPVSPTGEQVYKLTIKASNGGDATTRALKLETSGALTAYWEVNDVLTVTKGTTALYSELVCTAVNGDEATFEGTITGEVSANDALTLHYHMPTGFSVYAAQTGTLASAAARDYATATVTVKSVDSDNNITIKETKVNFTTQTAVLKLTLQDGSSNTIEPSSLTLSATMTFTGLGELSAEIATFDLSVNPYYTNGPGILYFALPEASIAAEYVATKLKEQYPAYATYITTSAVADALSVATLTYAAEYKSVIYTAIKSGYNFVGGTYYAGTLTMYDKMAASAAPGDLGKLICTAGHIHAYNTDAGCTAERVAKIIYVGATSNATYSHGLALALSDANGGSKCVWSTSYGTAHVYRTTDNSKIHSDSEDGLQYNNATHNSDTYPAFKAAMANNGKDVPTGCSAWFLPSGYQWQLMIDEAGGFSDLCTGFTVVGGTNMQSDDYWSSTETDDVYAWAYHFGGSWRAYSKDYNYFVRSAIAF